MLWRRTEICAGRTEIARIVPHREYSHKEYKCGYLTQRFLTQEINFRNAWPHTNTIPPREYKRWYRIPRINLQGSHRDYLT